MTMATVAVKLAQTVYDVSHSEAAVRNLAPVRARKYSQSRQVLGADLNLPPLGIQRQFAPHVSAATEQQSAANGILTFIGEIRIEHNLLQTGMKKSDHQHDSAAEHEL